MCSSRVIFALKDDVTFDLQSAWNARADLHAEAIEAAEQRGYAAGIRAAVEIANDAFPDYEGGCSLQDQAARDLRDQIVMDIRALTPTPPAPVTVQPLPETHHLITLDELQRHFGESIPMSIAMIIADNLHPTALETRQAINRALAEQEV
jgi:hypothetical protein